MKHVYTRIPTEPIHSKCMYSNYCDIMHCSLTTEQLISKSICCKSNISTTFIASIVAAQQGKYMKAVYIY